MASKPKTRIEPVPVMEASEPWHALETIQVYESLDCSNQGLSRVEAEQRLALYGENKLPEAKPVPPHQWIEQWKTLFNDNPEVSFYKVNLTDGKTSAPINEWKMCSNLKYIDFGKLDKILDL